MYGDGGQGNHLFAKFQASLLGRNQPPSIDPAEEHMNNVKKVVFRWAAALVLVGGAGLWIGGTTVSAAVVAGATLATIAALVSIRRRAAQAG